MREKLFELGVPGLSVIDAKGIGKPLSQFQSTQNAKVPQFLPRVASLLFWKTKRLMKWSKPLPRLLKRETLETVRSLFFQLKRPSAFAQVSEESRHFIESVSPQGLEMNPLFFFGSF